MASRINLWLFAPWLRPDDYVPPGPPKEVVPLGPPVPEPLLAPSPPVRAPFAGGAGPIPSMPSSFLGLKRL